MIRVLKRCLKCGEMIPTMNGRFCFHLAPNTRYSRYRVCPGSQNPLPLPQFDEQPPVYYVVPSPVFRGNKKIGKRVYYAVATEEEPAPKIRHSRICIPCKQDNHLLCEDDCECECADTFDLPHSLHSAGYRPASGRLIK